ncbi:MAG: hypothetical protein DWH75_02655 [Planctomycetota bacterium]|nr:MAG: hypothetical protein DWH75_02655 [Planctomycetota bacterium]
MNNTHSQATIDSAPRSQLARGSKRSNIGVVVVLASIACGATYGMQAPADPNIPPQPDKGLNLYSPVGGYALMAIATAAVIAVNLMPAKRGHQD